MNAARARRLLLAAIAISLLIHLILAAYLRWGFRPNAPNEVVRVRTMTIARRPVPTPPPTPVPTVHPSLAPTAAPSARVVPPSLKTHGSNGPPHVRAPGKTVAAPTPAPATESPAPLTTATPAGACPNPDAPPAVSATPDVAQIPEAARASKVSGTAAIAVKLDANGNVTDASVAQSSGNTLLDAVAMQMARGATYSPKYTACKAVAGGTYTYRVKFVAW